MTYGAADFLGGLMSRRSSVFSVVFVSQAIGFAFLLVGLPLLAENGPTVGAIAWGAASGLARAGGITFLYLGLARGRMSVVAPVTAVESAAVPALFGFAVGERLGPVTLLGLILAVVALVFLLAPSRT